MPNVSASTWRPVATAACRNSTSARAYGSIEPEMSQMKTTRRSTSFWWPEGAVDRLALVRASTGGCVRRGSISSPPCDGLQPARPALRQVARQPLAGAAHLAQLGRAHLGEVLGAQQLVGRERRGRQLGVVGVDRVHRDLGDGVRRDAPATRASCRRARGRSGAGRGSSTAPARTRRGRRGRRSPGRRASRPACRPAPRTRRRAPTGRSRRARAARPAGGRGRPRHRPRAGCGRT